jgi:hypothetical protein
MPPMVHSLLRRDSSRRQRYIHHQSPNKPNCITIGDATCDQRHCAHKIILHVTWQDTETKLSGILRYAERS